MMYTTKFLDGLDGLVSGIGAIGAIILFIVSLFWDVPQSGTSILALILAGSCLGFLRYNWHPAKIFLGESGSVFIGFMLAVLAIISGAKIATALLIMGIPMLDVAWVILRRIFKEHKSPFAGDAKHLHFRLLQVGFSHRRAVLFLYLLVIIFGTSSLFLQSQYKIVALGILLVMMIILASSLVLTYKKKKSMSAPGGKKIIFLFLFLLFFLTACNQENQTENLKTIKINGHEIKVELADTPAKRVQGLSGRQSLPGDQGMLFIFDTDQKPAFWMKDMRFPIDIIWIKDDTIIGFEQNILPETYQQGLTFAPLTPIDKVLEVGAFFIENNQINRGQKIK